MRSADPSKAPRLAYSAGARPRPDARVARSARSRRPQDREDVPLDKRVPLDKALHYARQVFGHLNSYDAGNPAWLRVQAHGSLRFDLHRLKTYVDNMIEDIDSAE